MPVYVSLVKFTRDGIMTMKDQGVSRSEAIKRNAEELGGKLVNAYYCLGEYDVVAIWEFPNNKAAMKAAVKSAALGHIQISTMPALPRHEWTELLGEVFGKKKK
jgi:uncharacterized protein with GYD domain